MSRALHELAHFAVVCFAIWPLNESEAGVDFVFIQTFLRFTSKACSYANKFQIMIIYMYKASSFTTKVKSSLASTQKHGHETPNCKMTRDIIGNKAGSSPSWHLFECGGPTE